MDLNQPVDEDCSHLWLDFGLDPGHVAGSDGLLAFKHSHVSVDLGDILCHELRVAVVQTVDISDAGRQLCNNRGYNRVNVHAKVCAIGKLDGRLLLVAWSFTAGSRVRDFAEGRPLGGGRGSTKLLLSAHLGGGTATEWVTEELRGDGEGGTKNMLTTKKQRKKRKRIEILKCCVGRGLW